MASASHRRTDREAPGHAVGTPATVPTAAGDGLRTVGSLAIEPSRERIARRACRLYEAGGGDQVETLFWSRRGEVACRAHAPARESGRWQVEAWCAIPESANGRHGLEYQCPRCAPDGRSYRPTHLANRDPHDIARSA